MSKCPSCGTKGVYIGLNVVECTKYGCKNYSGRDMLDHVDYDNDIVQKYLFSSFGDANVDIWAHATDGVTLGGITTDNTTVWIDNSPTTISGGPIVFKFTPSKRATELLKDQWQHISIKYGPALDGDEEDNECDRDSGTQPPGTTAHPPTELTEGPED